MKKMRKNQRISRQSIIKSVSNKFDLKLPIFLSTIKNSLPMVLKSKVRKKCRSVKSGKVSKEVIPYNRKTNYKKKKEDTKTSECVICCMEVSPTRNNTIQCGKSVHTMCSSCKLKITDDRCPMCRSHNIPYPMDTTEPLVIFGIGTRFGRELTYQDLMPVFSESYNIMKHPMYR